MQKPFRPPATVDVKDLVEHAVVLASVISMPFRFAAEAGWEFVVSAETADQLDEAPESATLKHPEDGRTTIVGIPVCWELGASNGVISLRYEREATFRTTL